MSSTRERELVPPAKRAQPGDSAAPEPGTASAAAISSTAATTGATNGRFWIHAAVLLLALLAISALLDNGYPAISDEGAVLAQVDQLLDHADGRTLFEPASWRIDQPFAQLDPTGQFTPLDNSALSGTQYLPYAKHALYPVLVVPAWQLLGHHGAIAVSALAVWLAALAAAAIARRLRPELRLPTLWILGLASPLLFDSTVVMAHALGAAMLGCLVVCLLRQLERPGVVPVIGAVVSSAALVLLRSEGLLAVGAIVAVLGLMSIRWSRPLRPVRASVRIDPTTAVPAVLIAATGASSYLLDGRVAASLLGVGGIRSVTTAGRPEGLIAGRLSAVWISLLRPASLGAGWPAAAVMVCCLLTIAAGVILRFLPARRRLAVGCLVVAAGLAVLRQFAPTDMVSGLVPAFPILVLGLLFLRRADLRRPVVQLCLGVSAVTAVGIVMTSYAIGGGVEWGGRFFHLLLPLLVPLAVLGLDRARGSLPTRRSLPARSTSSASPDARPTRLVVDQRSIAVVSVLVVAASLSVLSLRTVADMRRASEIVIPAALAAADAATPPVDGGAPVLVSDAQPLGRSAWASIDDYRILRVPEQDDLDGLLDGLADARVGTVTVLVSPLQQLPDSALDRWSVAGERELPGWNISYVELHQR